MQNLVFFGTDHYSATVLTALLKTDQFSQISVVTDQQPGGSPVENLAKAHQLSVNYYPALPPLVSNSPSKVIGLCASFDHLLPPGIIELFAGNLYNLHPSLLPQYRNVSPVQYALALGDKMTGVTLFRISSGIDNGEIISSAKEPIAASDDTPKLSTRLFELGAQLFIDYMSGHRLAQKNPPSANLVFTRRLTKESGFVEWEVLQKLLNGEVITPAQTNNELLVLRLGRDPAGNLLHDLIRALSPWPSVWSLAKTRKGDLRLTLESVLPEIMLKIAGKPKAISWHDFTQYYL